MILLLLSRNFFLKGRDKTHTDIQNKRCSNYKVPQIYQKNVIFINICKNTEVLIHTN